MEANKFIKFKKSPNKNDIIKDNEDEYEDLYLDFFRLNLNFNIKIDNDLTTKLIINDNYDEYITSIGEGNINIEINNFGIFNIYGNYKIEEGVYMFTLGDLIRRNFSILEGGNIKWNGNIFDGELDIAASHRIKANVSNFISDYEKRKMDIDLIVKLSDRISKPNIELDISIPNSNIDMSSNLKERLNDKDQKMNNFITLMLFNRFASGDKNFFTSTIENISSKELLMDRLLDFIPDLGLINLDLRYSENKNIDGISSNDELEFVVSGNIINENIKINSVVGVPIGSDQSEIVGDIEIEVNLNEKGNFKLNIFNKGNQAANFYEPAGLTQGIGLSYVMAFDSIGEFYRRILGIKPEEQEETEESD